ncbi:MAG: hypothetical protein EPO28_18615 [Saprospiraceae bacterium]|nr:MAG: hypothetical protein EPO28_18615 [Saprospiraceae bacterium]
MAFSQTSGSYEALQKKPAYWPAASSSPTVRWTYHTGCTRKTSASPIFANVQKVADHIDHVVQLAGTGHVGPGSDFDGVGDSLPAGLKDVSGYPNLIAGLLKRGYSEKDIEKICYKNLFRVREEVEKVSKKMKRKG